MGRIILYIIVIAFIIAVITKFFYLLVAGALGYWAYKQFKKSQTKGSKQTLTYVLGAFAGVFLILFVGSLSSDTANKTEPIAVVDTKEDSSSNSETKSNTADVIETSQSSDSKGKQTQGTQNNHNRFPATLVEVTDGDTLKVTVEGKEEKVRLLLIDTPESVHPEKEEQPFAKDASNFVKKQVAKGNMELELDVSERDKYGRLLAYVWIDNKMLNEQLLEYGLARVAYIYPPNTKYVDQFEEIQKQARVKAKGIWSIENYVQDSGFVEPKPAIEEPVVVTQAPSVEKNNEVKNESIVTNVYYKNCDAVRAAGADPIYEGEPGYSRKLDRDGDGIGCER
ncbi:SPBc2 prophage-derived endonuclease YokF precursor [Paenibacillus sp. GM1FR]|uniref:thermonuclease family protein n=1 Tax=Paenibacillus sp. GM1FR TaxID=2059267 RepID=UPI000C27FB93|nr:thermonuclease family protein [Paenibacillus sp. GM1FR]PJN64546.1 SPBc2 prophage-derived endonuclease YokF precursor [Paenibacillus sp. GM1FR]